MSPLSHPKTKSRIDPDSGLGRREKGDRKSTTHHTQNTTTTQHHQNFVSRLSLSLFSPPVSIPPNKPTSFRAPLSLASVSFSYRTRETGGYSTTKEQPQDATNNNKKDRKRLTTHGAAQSVKPRWSCLLPASTRHDMAMANDEREDAGGKCMETAASTRSPLSRNPSTKYKETKKGEPQAHG